jgi:anthranilate phosphoribosyltransferase
MSGSADLLQNIPPVAPILEKVTPASLPEVFSKTNYAFLFAPTFHPGMRYVAPIRKELGWRTIFNLLGPLSNPVDSTGHTSSASSTSLVEARVIGVARKDLGLAFAQALALSGARKALVVCGDEELDELSCAGPTHCWGLREKANPDFKGSANAEDDDLTTSDEDAPPRNIVDVEHFMLSPADFGFPEHPLASVGPGKGPKENAETLLKILSGEMGPDEPVMHFVLINAAALFVVSGICDPDESTMGPGDDGKVIKERGPGGGRWKEGVRRARWAISSGAALRELQKFIKVTNSL